MLKKFGQIVLDYFLINFPNTYSFKLSIDDYTFSELTLMANLDEQKIIKAIQARETFCNNDLEALAIATYQVKIVGDVESIQSSGSDGYYQKIRDNYASYKNADNNSICNGYFSNQINLWRRVQKLFEKNGRRLEIPDDHPGAGRYVQYPVKSHEMKNTELLKWADEFRKRGLKPHDINVSYQDFCSLFLTKFRNESLKRTIYNFYKIWDGRSFSDILNKRPRIVSEKDLNAVDTKIVLDYLSSKIEFFNQESGEKINMLSEVYSLIYSQSNRVFFVQNEDDDFYAAKKNKIDFGLDFIIIAKSDLNIQDSYLENKFDQNFGKEILFVYKIKFSKDICTKLHIDVIQKPPLDLVGGLKKSRKCYYNFALPAIEFSQSQKVMYVNSNMVTLDSKRVVLSELPCLEPIIKKGGTVEIRLSDYLPVKFKVEVIDSEREKFDEIGWEFIESRYVPSSVKIEDEIQNGIVIGFNSTIEFKPINAVNNKTDNRCKFIIHKDYLENRFSEERSFRKKWLRSI